MKRRFLAILVGGLLFSVGPDAARAQDEGEGSSAEQGSEELDARTLFLQGQEAYQHGDYEAAVERWELAFSLDARPALQYNLAQAYGRLGRFEDELQALESFIAAADPSSPYLAAARSRVATLRERLARTGIVLSGGTEGAVVFIDGEERGRLPMTDPLSVDPGRHEVVVRAEGYQRFHSAAVVPAAEIVELEVQLQELERAPVPRTSIILWSAGGGVAGFGAILGGVAMAKSSGAVAGSSDADTARGLAIGADISLGLGAAAMVTGLVLYFTRGTEQPDQSRAVVVTPLVTGEAVGVGLGGRF